MSGTEARDAGPGPEDPRGFWRDQLNSVLSWLNDHAWPLAGVILMISLLHVHNYLSVEGIPISLASSAILSAIPVVFAKAALFVSALTALFLLPTVLLLTKVEKGGKNLLERMLEAFRPKDQQSGNIAQNPAEKSEAVVVSEARCLIVRWVVGFVLYGLPLGAAGFIKIEWVQEHPYISRILGLLILLSLMAVFVRIVAGMKLRMLKAVSPDFIAVCAASAFAQFILITYLVDGSASVAGQYIESIGLFLVILLVVLPGLAILQLIGAGVLHYLRGHSQPLLLALQLGIVLTGVCSLFPGPSARVVASTLQIKAPDGKPCAIFVRKTEPTSADAAMVTQQSGSTKIDPVTILLEADGTYYVRAFDGRDKVVDLVPKGDVKQISSCPEESET